MASLNTIVKQQNSATTHQGGHGVSFGANDELRRLVTNCYLFENTYYQDGADIAADISKIVSAPNVSVKSVLDAAHEALAAHLRHTPLWLLNALITAKKTSDDSYTMKWQDITPFLTRPDQAIELLAMYWATVGKDKPIPAMYKKAFRAYIPTLSRYQLAKYKQVGKSVQLRDIVRISRPCPIDEAQSKDFSDLIMNRLPNEDTWESRLSVPGADKKSVWTTMLDEGILGGLATLRNVRNMVYAGVDQVIISKAIRGIKSKYITAGQIVQAYKQTPDFMAEYDELFAKLFDGDKLPAEVAIMVDVSGSMNDALSKRGQTMRYEVAAGLAAQLANSFERAHVYTFDRQCSKATGRNMTLVRDICGRIGGSTDCYGTWSSIAAMHRNAHLVMITDEQDGNLDRPDRSLGVNKLSFIINVAPYKVGLDLPNNNIERINGWSDKIPGYIVDRIMGDKYGK